MSEEVVVREARETDIPTCLRFLVKLDAHVAGVEPEVLKLNREGERQLARRLHDYLENPWSLLLVAEDGDTGLLVAMGDIALWHYEELWHNPERLGIKSAVIDDIWVEPDYRQSGLGKAILDRLVTFAETHGVNDLQLEYAVTNEEASATWERLGFRTTGIRATAHTAEVRRRLAGKRRKKKEATP